MKKSFLLYVFPLAAAFFFTCSNNAESPFSRDKAKVFLVLQSSDKAFSDSAITDTVDDTVRIGVVFFMSWYFDSVLVTAGKSITTIDTFFVCKKADIKGDTVWYSCSFASAGIRSVNVTGYVEGGYRPTASGTISILEKPIPKTPHAISQTVSLKEDSSTVITLSAIDYESQQIAAWQIIDTVKHGILIGSTNNFTYTPQQYYHGPDTFTFRASDGTKWGDTAVVSINVVHVNHPPAWKQSTVNLSIKEGKTLDLDLSTIFDKDPDGDSVKFFWKSGIGSIKADGKTWTWSPDFKAAQTSPAACVISATDNGAPKMSSDITLSISVTDSVCTLTLTLANGQGTITTIPAGTAFDPGTTVEIAAKPATDYIFRNWQGSVDSAATGTATISVVINTDKSVSAVFVKKVETVILNIGELNAHGTLYHNGYFYTSTVTAPAQLLRFNADSLADYGVINFSPGHDNGTEITYSSTTDKIYTIFKAKSKTLIAEINPQTFTSQDDKIIDSTQGTGSGPGSSITTDGNYLYAITYSSTIAGKTTVNKYSLSTFSGTPVASSTIPDSLINGHSIRYYNGMLYLIGGTSPPPMWIAKIRPTDMSLLQIGTVPGINFATDDFAIYGNYLFIGSEAYAPEPAAGYIYRVNLNDVSQIYTISTGVIDGPCWGVKEASTSIYAVFAPNTIVKIDPVSLQITKYKLDYFGPNEIAWDGKRLFITFYMLNPGIVQAFDPSYLIGKEIP